MACKSSAQSCDGDGVVKDRPRYSGSANELADLFVKHANPKKTIVTYCDDKKACDAKLNVDLIDKH